MFQMDSRSNDIPDRWLGCPKTGELVDDTFLPLKTPLGDDIPTPDDFAFTPHDFIKYAKDRKIDVGLVINLSFSTKYYDSADFIDDHGIEFKRIACRGHNEAPKPNERSDFIKTCNSFLARNPKKIIAVHCTHGFNRTGFMICCYLCSERDWSIDAAVSHFATKRPPGIYKQDYINELFNIFGDSDDPITQAPPKPDWDLEEGMLMNANPEFAQTASAISTIFYEGITEVQLVRDESLKHRIYRHCCLLCNYNLNSSSIAFPGAQPVSLDKDNIQLLKSLRYRVSWKADGCRYMMYIQDEENVFFLTRSLQLWRVSNLKFPKLEDLSTNLTDTLLDGEMVTDVMNGQKIPRYLIYDVISLNGNIVADQNFDKRLQLIERVIVEARRKAKHANLIPAEGEPFKIISKGFFHTQYSRKTWNLKVAHEKDGLIFQPVDEPYTGGTCQHIMKWKPPHLNSIDFKLIIREERQNGCLPETYACLHVSNKADAMTKFKLAKDQQSYHQYNGKIVEMTLSNNRWTVMREREDKLYANSYETACSVYKSIRYPVTEEILFNFIEKNPN